MIVKNDDSSKKNCQQLGKQPLNCSNKSGVKILSIWGLYSLAASFDDGKPGHGIKDGVGSLLSLGIVASTRGLG